MDQSNVAAASAPSPALSRHEEILRRNQEHRDRIHEHQRQVRERIQNRHQEIQNRIRAVHNTNINNANEGSLRQRRRGSEVSSSSSNMSGESPQQDVSSS